MFDFIFGGKQKIELIRELLEQRMRGMGYDDMQSKIHIKKMGNFELIGTPEGTLVSIIELIIKMQKSGMLIWQIIDKLENHRHKTGHDPVDFNHIMSVAKSAETAGDAVPMYCQYRLMLEYPNQHISEEDFTNAMMQATTFLMSQK